MGSKRINKKFLKIAGLFFGSFLILLTAFHFWFVHHAEEILQNLVASKSGGKIKLEVENFKFNWFSRKMELENAVLYTPDSGNVATSYRFKVRNIKVRLRAIIPLLFQDIVLIDKLSLRDPDIIVTRFRASKDSTRGDKVSLTQEMGRIYNSIQDALNVLQVKKFEIENARFTLINKLQPDQLPVTIGRIDFHIDNLQVDPGELTGKEKIFFSDNIALKSRDQSIIFPDGRHRISYRKFRINIEKKIVEFDSCTIAALRTDSASSEFSIFFDELVMTNIDFAALYHTQLIKADSVYCTNPQINLNVELGRKTGTKRTTPKLDEIIRQLTGDLQLNFVVVNNASFDIKTTRNGIPNSFTSDGNNFEMQGLRIDNKSQRPLKVEKFAMAIRNYETFLKDSTYEMQFDSVLFNDDKIVLDDFLFRQLDKGKTLNSFKVPRFQLSGLSWNDLLLERKLTAEQATLYNPVIRYTERGAQNEKSINRNIFDILANMNDVIMLQDLNIINGNIGLSLKGGIEMSLQKATLSVESRSLLGSEQLSEIRRSVNYLDFKRGIIKINDVTVNLDDIRYTGTDSRLDAGKALITNESNTLLATAKGVILDKILINEKTGDVIIDGIAWKQAEINLATLFSRSRKRFNSFVNLTDIKGKDSKFVTSIGGKRLSANFSDLKAIAFLFHPGEKPIIEGLHLNGNSLSLTDSAFRLHIGTFAISDLQTASFENASFENVNHGDSISIRVPLITFVPDIESAVAGQFLWGEMTIHQPVIRIKAKESNNRPNRGLLLIPGSIARLVILQPELLWSIQDENGAREIKWSGKKSATNSLVMLDVKTIDSAFSARQLLLSLNNFVYTNPGGKGFDEGQGTLTALINDFKYQETNPEEASWEGKLASLEGKNFLFDSLGSRKARLSIEYILLKDLAIKSSSLANIRNMISSNKKFRLQQFTGTYTDNIKHFAWYNAGYDKGTRSFTSDSMRYNPSVSKEKFDSLYPYQSDYIKISTGAIEIGPFDLDGYLSDSIMGFGSVKISETVLNDFRDNRLPFRSGIIKSLMVERLKKIPVKIAIDTLQFNNTNITYTEFNPRTNLPGVVHFNRANIKLFPVRNFNLGPTDSLRLHATGYLMDSIWTRLRLKQSYTDSLSGFLLTVRMKQADMQQLNPLFKSLAGAKLRSGYMDTLSMRIAGSEYLAYGEMKFLYRDLKVQLMDMETGKNRGLLTFLANNFLVRNKNIHRTSSVFFIRNRERSPLNYLVKLLTSGLLSGTGVKSNAKIIRQYKKELRQRNLPPLDYD